VKISSNYAASVSVSSLLIGMSVLADDVLWVVMARYIVSNIAVLEAYRIVSISR